MGHRHATVPREVSSERATAYAVRRDALVDESSGQAKGTQWREEKARVLIDGKLMEGSCVRPSCATSNAPQEQTFTCECIDF